jgi:hypothetical protein
MRRKTNFDSAGARCKDVSMLGEAEWHSAFGKLLTCMKM